MFIKSSMFHWPKKLEKVFTVKIHKIDQSTISRVHTGARPYLCRGCGSFFVDLEAVKDHIRNRLTVLTTKSTSRLKVSVADPNYAKSKSAALLKIMLNFI